MLPDWEAVAASYLPEWRAVVGFEDLYEVSSVGEVRFTGKHQIVARWANMRALVPCESRGYFRVSLSKNGKRLPYTIHRLVALAFLGPPPFAKAVIRHLNGDRVDNRVENLCWGTSKENSADRERHGRIARGDASWSRRHPERIAKGVRQWKAKLTEQTADEIRRLYNAGRSQCSLAKEYGVHTGTIWFLIHRRTWKHV